MGGSAVYDGWEFASPSDEVRTVVLVGKTGNGKSATGNSIIGTKQFKSKCSSGGVTQTCQLQTTVLEDGKTLNVIDTPGLFDVEHEYVANEIAKCIKMAKGGIHAVLLVLSVKCRFSKEEEAAVESLKRLFSSKIVNYMIIVFTNGDELEENDESLNDYLGRDCPESLKETLKMCGNRCVLFNNRTKDEAEKYEQLKKLLVLVNDVVDTNGGIPYTDELFVESKDQTFVEMSSRQEISQFNEQFNKTYEEQLQKMTEMVGMKLKEMTRRLEQQLAEEQKARAEEQKARLKAEETARDARTKSSDEMRQLREKLQRVEREREELRRRADQNNGQCAIL